MSINQTADETSNRRNLRVLINLRGVAFCAQIAAVLIAAYGFNLVLPMAAMFAVTAILAVFNLYSLYRLRASAPIRIADLFIGLLIDVGVLTAQLGFGGGTANPFVSFYMLPVIIGAVMLSAGYAWAIYAATLLGYLALAIASFNQPMPATMHMTGLADRFNLHMHGMMLGYALSAGLLVFVVTRIRGNLQARDRELEAIKTRALQEDHIVRMGLLAAGAAHEIGTPLTTLSIILNDLRDLPMPKRKAELMTDVATMQTQVDRCKSIVSGILASSGHMRGEGGERKALNLFIAQVCEAWRLANPRAMLHVSAELDATPILADRVIDQALFSLLDNAFEASTAGGQTWVGLGARQEGDALVIDVEDRGPGFDLAVAERIGAPYTSTKGSAVEGRGLGLFLASNTLRVLGGRMEVQNRPDGGARVRLIMPLAAIGVGDGV